MVSILILKLHNEDEIDYLLMNTIGWSVIILQIAEFIKSIH